MIIFIIGLIIGAFLGISIQCMLIVAKDADEESNIK